MSFKTVHRGALASICSIGFPLSSFVIEFVQSALVFLFVMKQILIFLRRSTSSVRWADMEN